MAVARKTELCPTYSCHAALGRPRCDSSPVIRHACTRSYVAHVVHGAFATEMEHPFEIRSWLTGRDGEQLYPMRPILSRVILNPPFFARACADHLYDADRNLSISPSPAKALLANDRISRGAVSRGEYEIDTFYDISDESSERAPFFLQYISRREIYTFIISFIWRIIISWFFYSQKDESL